MATRSDSGSALRGLAMMQLVREHGTWRRALQPPVEPERQR